MQRRIIVLIALLFALPLVAQTKRLVSKIDVRGNVPAGIVTSQTAISEGKSYSDKDLDLAMARLRRLPFVFDATWSVDGGTLVIEVNPMSRFFGDVTATGAAYNGGQHGSALVGGGGRLFLGAGGVAQGLVTQAVNEGDNETFVEADYSHYGIAGTRLWARAAVGYSLRQDDGVDQDPTWSVEVGYPLTIRQSLLAQHTATSFSVDRTFPDSPVLTSSSDYSATRLLWTWDTTDDPFFARQGEVITAGPSRSRQTSHGAGFIFIGPGGEVGFYSPSTTSETTSLDVEAKKYFATGSRGALFAGIGASKYETENDFGTFPGVGFPDLPGFPTDFNNTVEGENVFASAGYAHNLFDWASRPGTRQRIEGGVSYRRSEFDYLFDRASHDSYSVDAAYVLRHQYGTVRLQLTYGFD